MITTVGLPVTTRHIFGTPYEGVGADILSADNANLSTIVIGTPIEESVNTLAFTTSGTNQVVLSTLPATTVIGEFSRNNLNATVGMPVSISFCVSYTDKIGADIELLDGQTLKNAVNGLIIRVNGNQTLSAATGTLSVEIVGTPIIAGISNLSFILGDQTCTIIVTVISNNSTMGTTSDIGSNYRFFSKIWDTNKDDFETDCPVESLRTNDFVNGCSLTYSLIGSMEYSNLEFSYSDSNTPEDSLQTNGTNDTLFFENDICEDIAVNSATKYLVIPFAVHTNNIEISKNTQLTRNWLMGGGFLGYQASGLLTL